MRMRLNLDGRPELGFKPMSRRNDAQLAWARSRKEELQIDMRRGLGPESKYRQQIAQVAINREVDQIGLALIEWPSRKMAN